MGGHTDNDGGAAPVLRRRRLRSVAALATVAAVAVGAALWLRDYRRQHRFDPLIAEAAAAHGVDARLIWRVVRRESRFCPEAVGAAGEIGLMQITVGAAQDWALANRQPPPAREALFDPALNLRIGAWYLARALTFWGHRDEPAVYALAEYNAGRSNALRWAANAADANAFLDAITYPSTRRYIRDVLGHR